MAKKSHNFVPKSARSSVLLNSRFFTEGCRASMPLLALACEIAFDAGFPNLATLYEKSPNIAQCICTAAKATLREHKNWENYEKNNSRTVH